ncbi:MAG: APC family permease [Actinomycetota bacterium]
MSADENDGEQRRMGALKRLVLGRPLASEEAHHQLLPKILALPVFASDALSSVAYATEEIMLVLILAGTALDPGKSLGKSMGIAIAVAILMAIVVISYRQTVRAYPSGGGAYIVTHENLGELPGLVAAAALLTDYILTVAVSIAAGAFAVASLVHSLNNHRVALSLGFIVIIAIANLRGTKESGALFAIPTYAFVLSILAMLAIGVTRCSLSTCAHSATAPAGTYVNPAAFRSLSLFLILRAFASGSTALTGVEAIANGVPAFRGRRPAEQAHNAAMTLGFLGVIAITMFVGITYLANAMGARPSDTKSIVAQVADATFHGGFGFAFVQIATALVLVLAANTAYQDFPRLSSILAKDRFMPRQFINRGDRLVFSNGIFVLTTIAAALILIYQADVTRLIQLYVLGVFTSFTLSQTGMVRRWRTLKPPGYKRNAVLNGVGAVATFIVLIVVAITKFTHGAYLVVIAVPLIVLLFKSINRHYLSVAGQLRLPEQRPQQLRGTRALVLVKAADEATMRALGYARSLRPLEVRAIHVGTGEEARLVSAAWDERRLPTKLEVIAGSKDDIIDPIRTYVRGMNAAEDEVITVVMPEIYEGGGARQFLRRRRALLLKAALLFERRVVVTDVPVLASQNWTTVRGPIVPTRTIAIVLVSAVHNATLRALEYARSLSPTELRAVTFNVDHDETMRVLNEWSRSVANVPLEAIDSPYREVTRPLVRYARQLHDAIPDSVVSVIVPEFVVRRWWHQFLHNQTALGIKYALIFEPGIVVTSVPFHME